MTGNRAAWCGYGGEASRAAEVARRRRTADGAEKHRTPFSGKVQANPGRKWFRGRSRGPRNSPATSIALDRRNPPMCCRRSARRLQHGTEDAADIADLSQAMRCRSAKIPVAASAGALYPRGASMSKPHVAIDIANRCCSATSCPCNSLRGGAACNTDRSNSERRAPCQCGGLAHHGGVVP